MAPDDLSWALAAFVGATLAPTDAALSAQVINDQRIPRRLRRVLNLESGLNDGIVTPIVAFTLAVAASELGTDQGHSSKHGALLELAVGLAVGLVIGVGTAWPVSARDGTGSSREGVSWPRSEPRSAASPSPWPLTAMASSPHSWLASPSERRWTTRSPTWTRSMSFRTCWARCWRSSCGSSSGPCWCRSPSRTSAWPSLRMHC